MGFLLTLVLPAQETQSGLHLPVQISVNGLFSDRFQNTLPESLAHIADSQRNSIGFASGGVRLLASPTLKFNKNWFVHATFSLNTEPYYAYSAYHVQRPLAKGNLIQAYAGYTAAGESKSVTFKVGKMASAFGAFASRYSDTVNPLIDAPQPYGSYLALRTDRIPCSNFDLEHQQNVHPNISAYHCATDESYKYGILPITPYGVIAAEMDVNFKRIDARVQLTNSSPGNPQSPTSSSQRPQWAAGGGISLWQGLRVGMSGYRGPWLSSESQQYLPPCCRWRRFKSRGIGVDAQYARGRYSVQGEWMNLKYEYPNYISNPAVTYSYIEAKAILTPRTYIATRIGSQNHNVVIAELRGAEDTTHNYQGAESWQPNRQAYEVAVGIRPTRHTLLKVGQQWVKRGHSEGPSDNIFMLQLVTSLPDVWKSFSR